MVSVSSPLRKFAAPEFVLGSGASGLTGSYAANFGASRAFLATDPGVAAAGHAGRVRASLEAAGIECETFSGISANPRDAEVRLGASALALTGCDLVVAVGGGSVMDCAKAISLMVANRRDVLEFEGIDRVRLPGLPLICVPTTAGTAADISQFAIINATARRTKIAVVSKKAIPDVALVDPELTATMDAELTAATGMDALSHAVEAYASTASSPVTDVHALEATRLASRWLARAVRDGGDMEARIGMTRASLFAGLAFSNAGLGAVHALAHALGGELDLPHGLCNALLLGAVVDYNFEAAPQRYGDLAAALAGEGNLAARSRSDPRRALGEALAALRAQVGLGAGLASRGLVPGQIPALARKALADACLATNPRRPTLADLEALLERSL